MSELDTALEALRQGRMIILVDDEDRENEGDLVLAAQFVTPEAINFMATHARGLICLALEGRRVDELGLPMMTAQNRSPRATAFTVSIEAREGVSTGISAHDRALTVQVAADPARGRDDLITPGHIFPLRAVDGGVLVRAGHTEGSVDLMRAAGLRPAAVICEVMKADGTMARLPDLQTFAAQHGLPIVSIKDVITRRLEQETLVSEVARSVFTPRWTDRPLETRVFKSGLDGLEHVAIVAGPLTNPVLVRMQAECVLGDTLGSATCDCGEKLQAALRAIAESGNGVLVFMRTGIGLAGSLPTGHPRLLAPGEELRHYGLGAQILRHLGVSELRLLTSSDRRVVGIEAYQLKIVESVQLQLKVGA